MLAKSEAREDEAVARLQVMEVKSAQEIATANKEVRRFSRFDTCSTGVRGSRVCWIPANLMAEVATDWICVTTSRRWVVFVATIGVLLKTRPCRSVFSGQQP